MTSPYTLRPATAADAETIVYQRSSMFKAMGVEVARVEAAEAPFRLWLVEKLAAGEYLGWLALSPGGEIVAGAGMWLKEWIPNPYAPSTPYGYILNVFTEPEHRGQGLAHRLVDTCVAYCQAHDIPTLLLHASDAGRPIYERIGFSATNEMRLRLQD